MSAGLAPDYQIARQRFVASATAAGAVISSFVHPSTGPDGGELAIDVAEIGAADAEEALFVFSATHGVEGFAGSAIQSNWLEHHADRSEPVRKVFIHGLNPYGFAWVRRVNEDNVDLNRNFIDWSRPPPPNEPYRQIARLLVPDRWDAETQQATTLTLLQEAERIGLDAIREIVSGGQYDDPKGVFYGGHEPVWSHRWLESHAPRLAAGAERIGIIDLHTGLGPWGHGELISHDRRTDAGYQRGQTWWGDVRSMRDGESVSAALTGDWLGRIGQFIPGVEITAAALEFGTVDDVTVLQSLRADAWLHAYGDRRGPEGDVVRAQVRAAFADEDPAWLDAISARFDQVADAALTHLAR